MKTSSQEISELIDRCFGHTRDPKNFELLYKEFSPHLRAILASISQNDPGAIEDSIHDAFIKYTGIFADGKRPSVEYVGYFVAIAKNCLYDQIRANRRIELVSDIELRVLIDEGLSGRDSMVESQVVVWQALHNLSARCRYVLQRWYIAGDDASELAVDLKVTSASVYVKLQRCRDELLDILRQC